MPRRFCTLCVESTMPQIDQRRGAMEPRVYKCPRRRMVVFVCFGCFLLADGLFFFVLPIWVPARDAWGVALWIVLGFGACGLGNLVLVSTLTGHIDLYPDAIV